MNIAHCKLSILLAMLLLSLFWCTIQLQAQSKRYDKELPLATQRVIRSVARGPEGFLWFGTKNGLFRYDGHRYIAYTNSEKNPNQISQNNVLEVLPTSDGKLVLFNNIHTVDILDPLTNALKVIDLGSSTVPKGKIRTASRQPDGQVLFITEHDEGFAVFEYSESGFIKLFERREARFTNPDLTIFTSRRFFISCLPDKTLLVYDQENGILHFDKAGRLLCKYASPAKKGTGRPLNFFRQISSGEFLLASGEEKGVYKFTLSSGKIEPDLRFSNRYNYGLGLADEEGNFLISANELDRQIKTFFILDSKSQLIEISDFGIEVPIEQFAYGRNFLDYFYAISVKGLFKIQTGLRSIKSFQRKENISIRGMVEDDQGHIIIATEWHGWYNLNPTTEVLSPIDMRALQVKDLNPPQYARNLLVDQNGNIWGSAYGNPPVTSTPDGYLLCYRPKVKQTKIFKNKYRIEALLQAKNGLIYLASNSTFQSFNPETGQFSDIPENYGSSYAEGVIPNCILESKNGFIWIGTDNGLARFNPTDQSFIFYGEGGKEKILLSDLNIMSIYEDADGQLWLGTQGGINCYHPTTGAVKVYNKRDGLSDDNVCGLLDDEGGNLWISTFKGLSYFDRAEKKFRNFYTSDGFNHDEFNRHALYRTKSGTYFVGGMDGFNAFRPEYLLKSDSEHKILFSELTYFDAKGDSLITHICGLSQVTSVVLPAVNRFLQVRFGLNNFSQPEQNSYSVYLEGYDTDWISQDNIAEVRYNNLPPGNYRLHVRGTGPSGTLSENTMVLDIWVKQFFFESVWFYFSIAFFVFGLVSLWIIRLRTEKNRLAVEVEKRTEQILSDKKTIEKQALELQTLDQMKSQFFANISHELRTPLTLILSPLKRMLSKDSFESEKLHDHLKLMEKNGDILQYRIQELLDLSRLDAGKATLRVDSIDLKQYLHQIIERFEPVAAQKSIELSFHWNVDLNFPVLIDAIKFEKIVSNLVSNALKFTSEGSVVVFVDQNTHDQALYSAPQNITITVQDTGLGIAPDELPFIFDRYFQTKIGSSFIEGTGIGLSMAQEYALLMGGNITVKSQPEQGSVFKLTLPIRYSDTPRETSEAISIDSNNIHAEDHLDTISEVPPLHDFTVLLVEDNSDLRHFLYDILSVHFTVVSVEHGQQAYEYLLKEEVPIHQLLILSDVMMPHMDGFELLERVRSKENLRKIPFIILTAKAGGEHRIKALRMGVDDYILKPFDEIELIVRVNNILHNLKLRQQNDNIDPEAEFVTEDITADWLETLENTVIRFLNDPHMGVDFLAETLGVSRSSLHRRIKTETGLTPNMYLREIRLQEARRLLENRLVLTVADAAQQVGLQKRAYFSNLYQQRFGRLPSTYLDTNKHIP